VHQIEMKLMTEFRMGLGEIDATDVTSIIGLLGYRQRLSKPPMGKETENRIKQIKIGKKIYRRVDVDAVNWLG